MYQAYSFDGKPVYSLSQSLSFCLLLIWLTPLIFFISASLGENVLPTNEEMITPKLSHRNRSKSDASKRRQTSKLNFMSIFRLCRKDKSLITVHHSPFFKAMHSPQIDSHFSSPAAKPFIPILRHDSHEHRYNTRSMNHRHTQLERAAVEEHSTLDIGERSITAQLNGVYMFDHSRQPHDPDQSQIFLPPVIPRSAQTSPNLLKRQ